MTGWFWKSELELSLEDFNVMILAGYRMPAPEGTPEEMYQLMLRCWEYDPERRPHFIQIYKAVDTLYSSFR